MITALCNQIKSCERKQTYYLWVTLATGVATAASTVPLLFTSATFYAYKSVSASGAPTNNGGNVYVGETDASGAVVAAGQPAFVDVLVPGDLKSKGGLLGTAYDLSTVWFLGATGDKILVAYEQ